MVVSSVTPTGLWSGYGGKHDPVPELNLISVRQTQEKIFFGVIEQSSGSWAFQVLVDGKPSTLNPKGTTDATPQDVTDKSEQAFWFFLPKEARRKTGRHEVQILTGYFENHVFKPTKTTTFYVIVNLAEEE